MDNYLSYRWPRTDGAPPAPVPAPRPVPPKKDRGRRMRRWAVSVVCALLALALLGSASFWAVNGIAQFIGQLPAPAESDDLPPHSSRTAERDPDWSPDDLPWGEPDPSVSLGVRPAGPALSGREVYQTALPSLVSVEAAHPGRFGGSSLGTGVVVTASGYVLTNYHIIDGTVAIRVQLLEDDARVFDAEVIGYDAEFDLAVLKFDPEDVKLTPARLGDSDQLAVGDWVYAVGNPMGYLTGSMSVGVVSALDREIDWDDPNANGALGLIQTDAALNPGNSGGALLNESGQVVGITSAKITGIERDRGEALENAVVLEGMGLAIPISDALPFVNRILATGETWRPVMGIQCIARTVDGRQGILVDKVTGSAAREAGLRKGDLILSANGVGTPSLAQLRRVLYRAGADSEVAFTVLRGGRELEIAFPLSDGLKED